MAAVLPAVVLLAGAGPLPAQQPSFTAPGPLADHPHAEATGAAAARLAEAWSASLFPPGPVELTSDECSFPGARHEILEGGDEAGPRARVVVCSGLVEAVRAELEAAAVQPAVRDSVLEGVLLFAYAHQTGHALSELPAPGPADGSEASVDQFTALSLVSVPRSAHWAALYWTRSPDGLAGPARDVAGALRPDRPAYALGHELDRVRMADLLCLIYGERPDRRTWMVETSLVAAGSTGRCVRAYRDTWERWGSIFDGRVVVPDRARPRRPAGAPGLGELDPGGAEAGGREAAAADTLDEPAPWGEARGLWSPYPVRVGDVVAPLLADILRARRQLQGRAVVTYEPSPGTLDVEIYGEARSADAARDVVEDYRDYIEDAFRPYLERRFGPSLRKEDLRILYYDASGRDPEPVIGLMRGRWVRP